MTKLTNLGAAIVAALFLTLTATAAHADCDALVRVNQQHGITLTCDGHVLPCITRWSAELTPAAGIEYGFECSTAEGADEDPDRRAVIAGAAGQVLYVTDNVYFGRLRFHTLEIFGRDYTQVYLETGFAEEVPTQQIFAWDVPNDRFLPLFTDTSYVMQIHGDLAGVSMFVPTIDTCDRTWTWDPGNSRFRAQARRGAKPAVCTEAD